MWCARETTLTFSLMYLSPLTSEVYLLVNLFSKLYVAFSLQWIAFIFGTDKKVCRVQEKQLSLSCYILIFPEVKILCRP